MKASILKKSINETIEKLKENGPEQIKKESLIEYLDDIQSKLDPSENSAAGIQKAELQKQLEESKNAHADSVEMFRSLISAGQNALHSSFLMNGGGALAMLAFLAYLTTSAPLKVPLFADALAFFVVGILITAITSGVTYLGAFDLFADELRLRPNWLFRKACCEDGMPMQYREQRNAANGNLVQTLRDRAF